MKERCENLFCTFLSCCNLHSLSELGERVPKGSYQILGITGPTILIIPEYNVVVAKMYNKRYNYGGDNYLYYLREFSNLVADTFRNGNRA
ncbi:hypothetical protein CMV37_26035 [Bacillus cereus]|nr:hypothetical protein CMV37_26035 [Bacillus cereus]